MSAKILEIRAKLNSKLNTCSVHIAMSRWFVDMKRLWGSCSLKAGLCLELKIDQQWSQVPLGMASKGFILTWWQWMVWFPQLDIFRNYSLLPLEHCALLLAIAENSNISKKPTVCIKAGNTFFFHLAFIWHVFYNNDKKTNTYD